MNGRPGLAGDTRGLAYRILLFGATAIAAALFIAAIDPAFSDLMTQHDAQTDTQAAATGASWVRSAWSWAPLITLGLGAVMIVTAAVVESRGP